VAILLDLTLLLPPLDAPQGQPQHLAGLATPGAVGAGLIDPGDHLPKLWEAELAPSTPSNQAWTFLEQPQSSGLGQGLVLAVQLALQVADSQWLIVFGQRRREMTARQAWEAYRQRYDIEHFFRFGKQRLRLASYQTPGVEHEENGWPLASLAYVQLGLAQPLAQVLPNPWERYALPSPTASPLSPALGQRDFERIIRPFGTPAQPPKSRGKSPGRRPGVCPGHRPTQPVIIKKAKKRLPQAARHP
jgi:hypothetical protein